VFLLTMTKLHYSLITLILLVSFALNLSPLANAQQTEQQKIYKKIEERIKKTKNRIQYIDRYGSWNDDNTSKYYKLTQLAFNKMLSIGEICYTSQAEEKLKECDAQTKKMYDAAKAGYRLTKYFAILSGKQNTCVMANLGVKPNRDGTPVEPDRTNFGDRPQSLYLCSGPDNSAINPDLRWRVEAKDKGMIKIKEEYRTDPNFMQNIDNQRNAEKLIMEVLGETY
jgi:hypothetical protein